MYNHGGRRKWAIWFPLAFVAFALLMGGVVMFLWNTILPGVTGVKELSYWQALGLLVLSRILFGGFGRGGGRHWGRKNEAWKEKWSRMSDEERTRFREEWKRRCGHFPPWAPPAASPSETGEPKETS